MPLKPVNNAAPLPVNTEEDVRQLFDLCSSIGRGDTEPDLPGVGNYSDMIARSPDPSFAKQMRKAASDLYIRGLADHFFYIGAVKPHLFLPLQQRAAALSDTELIGFRFSLENWLYLLRGASDDCVDALTKRINESPQLPDRLYMLAGIMTPYALSALANIVRSQGTIADWENLGFAIPEGGGAAEPRFLTTRIAVQLATGITVYNTNHPVGLPVSEIAFGQQPDITWHYLSLDLAEIPEAASLPFRRLHMVSPASNWGWSMTFKVTDDDRYEVAGLEADPDDELFYSYTSNLQSAKLVPFDDSLTYTNGHVLSTDNVYGSVGGPPIGLYANPKCPSCNKLMLHLCTIQNYINEYGDGFRCLYACEACRTAGCTGVSWN